GNRISGLTRAGEEVVAIARRMLHDSENIRRVGDEHSKGGKGRLVIATTHIHARYVLRSVIEKFTKKHLDVSLALRQGTPAQIAQWVAAGEADLGFSGKPPVEPPDVVFLACGELRRSVMVLRDHPLLRKKKKLTLEELATYPLITLDTSFTGGWAVMQAFANAGLTPNVVLSATDADVVKSYVELGLGIAILPSIACEAERDHLIASIDANHLFPATVTQIELRRGTYLRSYMIDFISMVYPRWNRESVERALASP
ncbi:MAG: transcriptional regulator, LysR family, partial [Rhizobacter sp.]|nr:transcriptional regulator, LysR family [Rhizobacter sp.]